MLKNRSSPKAIPPRSGPLHDILTPDGYDEPLLNLVRLLADAMHWCDGQNGDFRTAYYRGRVRYLAEINLFREATPGQGIVP